MQEYDIITNEGNTLAKVYAENAADAAARAGFTGRGDVWAVPSRYRVDTRTQPPVAAGYPAAPVMPVQQNVTVSGNENRRRVPHLLHFVLTVLTAGLWAIVWIIDAVVSGRN